MITIKQMPRIPTIKDSTISGKLGAICQDIAKLIRNRTLSGKDVQHNNFQGYAESTKKYKQKMGKATSPVRLMDTGAMLGSIDTKTMSPHWKQMFIDDKQAAFYGVIHQKGEGKMPQREWWGVNQADADDIFKRRMTEGRILEQGVKL